MNEPPSRHDVTVRVPSDDGHRPNPAASAAAASRAASSRNASVVGAHTAQEIICVVSAAGPDRPSAVAVALAVVADALRLRIWSGHPAGERPVPAVVRRLEEHRLPELVVTAVARDANVSQGAAARGRFPGWFAGARHPAHLRLAWPQLMTERSELRLVIEQRSGHLRDHALTGHYASTTDLDYRAAKSERLSWSTSGTNTTNLHCPAVICH
jgi:hypothetical protein